MWKAGIQSPYLTSFIRLISFEFFIVNFCFETVYVNLTKTSCFLFFLSAKIDAEYFSSPKICQLINVQDYPTACPDPSSDVLDHLAFL